MKIAAATILSALAFSSLVSAVPAKRDGLKCQAKYAPGPLAARAHFGSATERQYSVELNKKQDSKRYRLNDCILGTPLMELGSVIFNFDLRRMGFAKAR